MARVLVGFLGVLAVVQCGFILYQRNKHKKDLQEVAGTTSPRVAPQTYMPSMQNSNAQPNHTV